MYAFEIGHHLQRKQSSFFSRYEKWRMILSVVIIFLVVQWLILLPMILVLLCYGLFHSRMRTLTKWAKSTFIKKHQQQKEAKVVLINGCSQAMALHLARMLNDAGHRVIGCDYPLNWLNATRFSQAIDEYYTVPNPRRGVQEYIRALCLIADKENVDIFIPVSRLEDLNFDLLTKLPLERQGCRVLAVHSWKQSQPLRSGGFLSTENIYDASNNYSEVDQVEIENLKNVANRKKFGRNRSKSIPLRRSSIIDRMPLKHSFEIICEKVTDLSALMLCGDKCSSTCLIKNGHIIAMSTSPYDPRVEVSNWKEINKEVMKWSQAIMFEVPPEHQTGSLSFELFISPEGRVIPYSCRPYLGIAGLNIAMEDDVINCLIQKEPSLPQEPYQIVGGAQRYCFYPEVWKVLKQPKWNKFERFCSRIWNSSEAFFDLADPLPFFIHYHLHLPFVMAFEMVRGKTWTEIDVLHGKLLGC